MSWIGPETPYRRYTTANGIIAKPVVTLDSIQAGEARLEQVSASISSTMEVGLLGAAFFNNFTFQIDPAANVIAVVVNDLASFTNRYAHWAGIRIAGEYEGNLNDAGERVLVRGPLGETNTVFTYNDSRRWPQSPSLSRKLRWVRAFPPFSCWRRSP